jgi:methyl-accepting chemotaxis protein
MLNFGCLRKYAFVTLAIVGLSARESQAWNLGELFHKAWNGLVHTAQVVVHKVENAVLPPPVAQKLQELERTLNGLNPDQIKRVVFQKIQEEEQKALQLVMDQEVKNDLDRVLKDLQFIQKNAQTLIKGPCGPNAFVKRVPAWFHQQVGNAKDFFGIVKDGGAVFGKLATYTPDFVKFTEVMIKVDAKIAREVFSPEHRKMIQDTFNNFRKSIQALKGIPTLVQDTVNFVEDMGKLVTEGTTCAETLVGDITEGAEAVAEGLSGIAACATGVGCLEELATLKSAAVGAASTIVSDLSCAATVVTIAKDGVKDVVDMVKIIYTFSSFIKAIQSIQKDIEEAYKTLSKLSHEIQEDMPELEQSIHKISQDINDILHQFNPLIPRIRHFAEGLVLQFKQNINDLMVCKNEVGYVLSLTGMGLKDGLQSSIAAAGHILKVNETINLIRSDFEKMRQRVDRDVNQRVEDIRHRGAVFKSNPLAGLGQLPAIIKDAAEIPIVTLRDVDQSVNGTIATYVHLLTHHQDQAKTHINASMNHLSAIQKVKKEAPFLLQGAMVDQQLQQAHAIVKELQEHEKH